MKTKPVKIRWVKQDRLGSVRAAFLGKDGALHWPTPVGCVWASLRDITKHNNPETPFDVEARGGVYLICGELYVCEGCFSRVFKPAEKFLKSIAELDPVIAIADGGLNLRSNLSLIQR